MEGGLFRGLFRAAFLLLCISWTFGILDCSGLNLASDPGLLGDHLGPVAEHAAPARVHGEVLGVADDDDGVAVGDVGEVAQVPLGIEGREPVRHARLLGREGAADRLRRDGGRPGLSRSLRRAGGGGLGGHLDLALMSACLQEKLSVRPAIDLCSASGLASLTLGVLARLLLHLEVVLGRLDEVLLESALDSADRVAERRDAEPGLGDASRRGDGGRLGAGELLQAAARAARVEAEAEDDQEEDDREQDGEQAQDQLYVSLANTASRSWWAPT